MFYRSKNPTKNYNLGKKDIRELPLDKLAIRCEQEYDYAQESALAIKMHAYERMISKAVSNSSAESTEGLEEAMRETVPEPTLDREERIKLKIAAFKKVSEEFCEEMSLKTRSTWLPAQLLALIAHWVPVKNDDGTYDARKTLSRNLKSEDKWSLGAYILMVYPKRGSFVDTQYKPENIMFSSLVPFIMAGFKKFHNINYSQWGRDGLESFVEASLLEAMLAEIPDDLDPQLIIDERNDGLKYKSGQKAGTSRDPLTTYTLYNSQGTFMSTLPWLAKVMLAQIWCAHPDNRAAALKYLVLDPNNWDTPPEPLFSSKVLNSAPLVTKYKEQFQKSKTDLWD